VAVSATLSASEHTLQTHTKGRGLYGHTPSPRTGSRSATPINPASADVRCKEASLSSIVQGTVLDMRGLTVDMGNRGVSLHQASVFSLAPYRCAILHTHSTEPFDMHDWDTAEEEAARGKMFVVRADSSALTLWL
ncbi:hypothetical protein KIPB_011239, partial [Kipferlia bialata]